MKLIKSMIACFLFLLCTHPLMAVPVITSVTPSNGDISGGTVITITGTGFTGATAVDIGFRPATTFVVNTDTSITATVPVGTSGAVHVQVTAGSSSTNTAADYYTYTESSWEGIISGINQDAITLFDTGTNTISGTIPLPADSLSAIITPDGTTIYSADTDLANVNVIDAATNTIIGNIPLVVSGIGAFDMIVNPLGTRVYVSNNLSGYVTVIDTATNTVVADILTAPNLGPLSITPDGSKVYVSSFAFSNVTVIDTATNTVITSIPTGFIPGMTAITTDGTTAYVANSGSDTISIIDVASDTVTGTIVFPAGSGPYGSFILPAAPTMYVANINNDTVSVVDLTTNTIVDTIAFPPGSRPFWVVCTPDSQTVYVINENTDDVTPIDVATNTVGTSFAITGDIQDIVMSPDQAPVASFTYTLQPLGHPSQFDASASISPIGTIVSYAWDFDDGTTLVTASPIVNHIYNFSGTFLVTLTVTNSAGTSTTQVFSSRFMSNNGGPSAMIFQIVSVPPSPPTHVKGMQTPCVYLTQIDLINVLRWSPPAVGHPPFAYNIYRDVGLTDLIGTVPASGPLRFEDHNRKKKKYTYYIVSVGPTGLISPPVSVTVKPFKG